MVRLGQGEGDLEEAFVRTQHSTRRVGEAEKRSDAPASSDSAASFGDFTKAGRVAYALERRDALLKQVDVLAAGMQVPGDVGYTCETALFFGSIHVYPRIAGFRASFGLPPPPLPIDIVSTFSAEDLKASTPSDLVGSTDPALVQALLQCFATASASSPSARTLGMHQSVSDLLVKEEKTYKAKIASLTSSSSNSTLSIARLKEAFPFKSFVPIDELTLDGSISLLQAIELVETWFMSVLRIFHELQQYRPYEILQSNKARMDYMITGLGSSQ
jgi:hypothetical protein